MKFSTAMKVFRLIQIEINYIFRYIYICHNTHKYETRYSWIHSKV